MCPEMGRAMNTPATEAIANEANDRDVFNDHDVFNDVEVIPCKQVLTAGVASIGQQFGALAGG